MARFALLRSCVVASVLVSPVLAAVLESAEEVAIKEDIITREYETLYVLFGFVLMGAAVMHLTKLPALHAVPSTVIFFVLGIAFALIVEAGGFGELQWLMNSYTAWVKVDPHLLLFTFLPPLLFSDAFSVDTHIAMRTSGQCLILAVPGVVIGSFTSAALFQYLFPYGWDFPTSLMVGSILSATDPVAVVSLLKDLGASPVLTMQIQGESMLNDGTAMVLFTVAYKIVGQEECGPGCVVGFVLNSTLGAWMLGSAVGLVFFLWIRGASDKLWQKSSLVQIMLTIACAYWSYLLADGICRMSGVLSTVASALVLSYCMWPAVVEKKAMLEFWHVVETIGNTLVFFLAGMFTGQSMPHAEPQDYLWALAAYAMLTLVRLATLLVLWPMLNRAGDERVGVRDIAVMTWGGLRGLVGLALAILVEEDRAGGALSQRDGRLVLFIVGSVAALTLVVNATTAPLLCSVLGITQTVEGRKALVRNVAMRAEAHVAREVERVIAGGRLPRSCGVGGVREAVEKLTGHVRAHVFEGELDRQFSDKHRLAKLRRVSSSLSQRVGRQCVSPDVEAVWRRFEEAKNKMLMSHVKVSVFKFGAQLSNIKRLLASQELDTQQLKIVREVFLEVLRATYWEQVEQGKFVGTSEPNMLLASASIARDRCGECLSDWSILRRYVNIEPYGQAALEKDVARKRAGSQTWLQRWRLKRDLNAQRSVLQVVDAFIQAHEAAQASIATFFGQDESVDTPEEAFVILESQSEVFEATALLGRIAKPVQRYMCTAMESYSVCERFRDFVHDAHTRGVLQGREAQMLLEPAAHITQEFASRFRHMGDRLLLPGALHTTYDVDAALAIQRAFRRWRLLRSAFAVVALGRSEGLPTLLPRARRHAPGSSADMRKAAPEDLGEDIV
mmetsp:Transcript_68281/g.191307  ORF Transcript_68281/g.191307 Transcript_68281/m.191307 type:complete len:899 (+) Transcript_68281:87-2783(+)